MIHQHSRSQVVPRPTTKSLPTPRDDRAHTHTQLHRAVVVVAIVLVVVVVSLNDRVCAHIPQVALCWVLPPSWDRIEITVNTHTVQSFRGWALATINELGKIIVHRTHGGAHGEHWNARGKNSAVNAQTRRARARTTTATRRPTIAGYNSKCRAVRRSVFVLGALFHARRTRSPLTVSARSQNTSLSGPHTHARALQRPYIHTSTHLCVLIGVFCMRRWRRAAPRSPRSIALSLPLRLPTLSAASRMCDIDRLLFVYVHTWRW